MLIVRTSEKGMGLQVVDNLDGQAVIGTSDRNVLVSQRKTAGFVNQSDRYSSTRSKSNRSGSRAGSKLRRGTANSG